MRWTEEERRDIEELRERAKDVDPIILQIVEGTLNSIEAEIEVAVERTAPSAVIDYLLEKYPEAWKRYNKYSTRAEAMGDKKLLLPGE